VTAPRSLIFASSLTTARFVNPQVEVGGQTVVPTIVRGGEEVKPPPLNAGRVQELVTQLGPIARVSVPRAVSQSIPAGTRVQKGTPIDVVLVPVSDISLGLLDQVHDGLTGRSVATVLPVVNDPAVKPLLQKRAEDLTAAEKSTITTSLATNGGGAVTVDDTVPNKSFASVFNALVGAKAFQ